MTVLYSLGIRLYIAALYLAAPFNLKAKQMLAGRKNWYEKLKNAVDEDAQYVWFHCSSLGEFEQGRPLIEASKLKYPNRKILLSFFSPSGYEIRKNYAGADVVCYLPFDSRRNAKRFIALTNPSLVFFVKYEYWHFFLSTLKKKNIPTYLVSAIFRDKQIFFKWYGSWFKKILNNFTHIFVQDKASEKRLTHHGYKQVSVAGDTRFDRVADIVKLKKAIPMAEQFVQGTKVVVAGSSWPADEELLCNYINSSSIDCKFIIAPHEIHGTHIASIKNLITVPFVLYSQSPSETELQHAKVLIIDSIGILSSLYQYGNIAYIGGGFGVGIHNTLEAATYGIPVVFGPNHLKFREAVQLIENQGAFTISTYEELKKQLDTLLSDDDACLKAGEKAGDYVKQNTGASEKILQQVSA